MEKQAENKNEMKVKDKSRLSSAKGTTFRTGHGRTAFYSIFHFVSAIYYVG